MPALQRRAVLPNLRRAKATTGHHATHHAMVKSISSSSNEDSSMFDSPTKQLTPTPFTPSSATQLPSRYESDEESVSPCPEDFEDGSTFSDVDIDSSIELDADEVPKLGQARMVTIVFGPAKPILVNISKLAPIEKRTTSAHVRPRAQTGSRTFKTSIGRTIVMHAGGETSGTPPPTVALQRPPVGFRAPPPVPPRSNARTPAPLGSGEGSAAATPTPTQQSFSVPATRSNNHAHSRSISTVGTQDSMYDTDDGRSSVAGDSSASSAASSVDDSDSDYECHDDDINEIDEVRKSSVALRDQQDAELEAAINDYMNWRSEGSPGQPPESVFKLSNEDKQMVRDHEQQEWQRELERGLSTPTPTRYSAYDPFGVRPPSLVRPKAPFQGEHQYQQQQQQPEGGSSGGGAKRFANLRRGLNNLSRQSNG